MLSPVSRALNKNPAHGSGWIFQIPSTNLSLNPDVNPTNGSWWIVQIRFLRRDLKAVGAISCKRLGARRGLKSLVAFECAGVDGLVERKLLEADGPFQCLRPVWKLHDEFERIRVREHQLSSGLKVGKLLYKLEPVIVLAHRSLGDRTLTS